MNSFGPNTASIINAIEQVRQIPWFTRIEQPHPEDATVTRAPITWLLDRPERPWQGALGKHEQLIELLLFDSGRLQWQVALDQSYRPKLHSTSVDDLLIELDEKFPGYYGDTHLYPHELIDLHTVERIIRFALYEHLVDDLGPRPAFFRMLLGWFNEGYWPCGWSAEYPDGHLIVI
jgi:hypothetical protein